MVCVVPLLCLDKEVHDVVMYGVRGSLVDLFVHVRVYTGHMLKLVVCWKEGWGLARTVLYAVVHDLIFSDYPANSTVFMCKYIYLCVASVVVSPDSDVKSAAAAVLPLSSVLCCLCSCFPQK